MKGLNQDVEEDENAKADHPFAFSEMLPGRFILKGIDFEVSSERASQISVPRRPPDKRLEIWEINE